MKKKLSLLKLKVYNIIQLKKLMLEPKKTGIIYLELIIISLLFSKLISYFIFIDYYTFDSYLQKYEELFTNTGIALIGFSGIIFTLQIFSQEEKNNYTNSVMEKLIDIKFQHIIQYVYISIITLIFIFLPTTSFFYNHLVLLIPFYYITIVILFIMFGIDLFVSTGNSNKFKIIKIIEKRTDLVLEVVENQYKSFDKYCKKENFVNPPLYEYITKSNSIFISYIQCVNVILRSSIDDPILFQNGMQAYINITNKRLEKRKNYFKYLHIPFLTDTLPKKDNDTFIEKFILEYLDEYAQIALKNKNRDILSIVQQTYHQILIFGKDNKYTNNNELELTIKIIFIYYIKIIRYIVEFNNDNMLFETIEIFKELFINNFNDFGGLIDESFTDEMKDISRIALSKKSLMNYRNIQGLIVIPVYALLNGNDKNKRFRLDYIFSCLKSNLIDFTKEKNLIKRKDESRIYLNYMFNTMEQYSYFNFLINYFNKQLNEKSEFRNNEFFDDDLLKPFVDFINDDVVIWCLTILDNDNRYVTGFVDIKEIILIISQMLIKVIYDKNFNHIKDKNIKLLLKCFSAITKTSKKYKNIGLSCHNVNEFFTQLFYSCKQQIISNDEIKQLVINGYYNGLKDCLLENTDKKISFDYFYSYINFVLDNFEDESIIINLIDWYKNINNNSLYELFKMLEELSKIHFFGNDKLSFENYTKIKSIVMDRFESKIKSISNKEINNFIENNKLDIIVSKKKNEKIELIMKQIREE